MKKTTEDKIKDLPKLRRGVYIPKELPKERGNPNRYFMIPQEGDPTEINWTKEYCVCCKKETDHRDLWVGDPLQPEDLGIKGEKVDPYWLENSCKECNIPKEGLSVYETDS